MQLGNFIDVSLARHVSGKYTRYQEHQMSSCSIWFSAPSFWMGCGLESCFVGRVYGADGALHSTIWSCLWCLARHHLVVFMVQMVPRMAPSGHVYGADGAVHGTICTVNTTYKAALKTTTHPKTQCRKPYAATQHLMLLMKGVCTRNMSS
jgi:hypothetical protein